MQNGCIAKSFSTDIWNCQC